MQEFYHWMHLWDRQFLIKILSSMRFFVEAIPDHLIHQLRSQEVGSCLTLHRTKFHDIHADNSCTLTNLAEQIQQLIPVESARFRSAHSGHLARINRIQ